MVVLKRLCQIIIISIILISTISCGGASLSEQIRSYAENNDELRLSEITNFDWDVAYIDRDAYQNGERIQEEHGIIGEFRNLESGHLIRVAFVKDRNLVYDLIVGVFRIDFDDSIEVIYPNDIFEVTWFGIPTHEDKRLFLSPK